MIVKVIDNGMGKWYCLVCGHKWLPQTDKEYKSLRCPNFSCRKLAGYTGLPKQRKNEGS